MFHCDSLDFCDTNIYVRMSIHSFLIIYMSEKCDKGQDVCPPYDVCVCLWCIVSAALTNTIYVNVSFIIIYLCCRSVSFQRNHI